MTPKNPSSIPHEEALIKELAANPKFALEYLKAAMEDQDEPQTLLIALRQVLKATGGMAVIAKQTGIERESLYRALSNKGNPRYSTLNAIIRAIGLKLTVATA